MLIKHLRILFLLSAGLAYTTISSGWTAQIHIKANASECDHCHCDRRDNAHETPDESHDSESCALCQQLALLSKQVYLSYTSALIIQRISQIQREQTSVAIFPQVTIHSGSPRAPPMFLYNVEM